MLAAPTAASSRLLELWRDGLPPLDKLVTTYAFENFGDAWRPPTRYRALS
jgi:hypothetical protein